MELSLTKSFKFLGFFCAAVARSFCILILELSTALTFIGNIFFIYIIYNKIGIKVKKKYWTIDETEFLIENAGILLDKELAEKLKKSLKAVRRKRENLGLVKVNGRSRCDLINQALHQLDIL